MSVKEDPCISICKGGRLKSVLVHVKHPFFEDKREFVTIEKEGKVTIKKTGVDYTGKTKVASKTNSGWANFVISNSDLPLGKFSICDEETNEDELVFYTSTPEA